MNVKLELPEAEIKAFCRKWQVTEMALFGSVIREDFGPESDIDILLTFHPDASHSLFDMVRMREELCGIFGREVDLVSRRGLESSRNHLMRQAILGSAEVVYAA